MARISQIMKQWSTSLTIWSSWGSSTRLQQEHCIKPEAFYIQHPLLSSLNNWLQTPRRFTKCSPAPHMTLAQKSGLPDPKAHSALSARLRLGGPTGQCWPTLPYSAPKLLQNALLELQDSRTQRSDPVAAVQHKWAQASCIMIRV